MALINGCIAYYKMDGDATDATGNGNNGTVNGATLTTGKINQGYSFDNINDWIDSNTNITSNFSYSSWVNISVDNSGAIIAKYDGSSKIFQFYYNDALKSFVLDFGQVGGTRNIIQVNTIALNTWYNVIITWDGTTSKIYLNGDLKDSSTTIPSDFIDTLNLQIGRRTDGSYFGGKLDEIGFWNRGLIQSEATELYNGGAGLQYPFGFKKKLLLQGGL